MTNYESGKYIAQVFSHDPTRLLKAIYNGTVEPNKLLNDFEKGVIDEIKSWTSRGETADYYLKTISIYGKW